MTTKWPAEGLETLPGCPVCGSTRARTRYRDLRDILFESAPGSWTVQRCLTCGLHYPNPRPSPQHISLAYARYYTHQAEPASAADSSSAPRTSRQQAAARRHLPHPSPGMRLLDLGCGSGAFVATATDLGWIAEGLEPDPKAVEAAESIGIKVRQGGLPETGLESGRYHAVTLNHVIEHVHDPVASLREVRRLLAPGGRVWLATPNTDSISHRRYGSSWRGLEPPRHLALLNPSSIRRALRTAGFTSIRMERAPLMAYWYFQSSEQIARKRGIQMAGINHISSKLWLLAATARALVRPGGGEELMVSANRP